MPARQRRQVAERLARAECLLLIEGFEIGVAALEAVIVTSRLSLAWRGGSIGVPTDRLLSIVESYDMSTHLLAFSSSLCAGGHHGRPLPCNTNHRTAIQAQSI